MVFSGEPLPNTTFSGVAQTLKGRGGLCVCGTTYAYYPSPSSNMYHINIRQFRCFSLCVPLGLWCFFISMSCANDLEAGSFQYEHVSLGTSRRLESFIGPCLAMRVMHDFKFWLAASTYRQKTIPFTMAPKRRRRASRRKAAPKRKATKRRRSKRRSAKKAAAPKRRRRRRSSKKA